MEALLSELHSNVVDQRKRFKSHSSFFDVFFVGDPLINGFSRFSNPFAVIIVVLLLDDPSFITCEQ